MPFCLVHKSPPTNDFNYRRETERHKNWLTSQKSLKTWSHQRLGSKLMHRCAIEKYFTQDNKLLTWLDSTLSLARSVDIPLLKISSVTFGNTSKYLDMGYFYRSLSEKKKKTSKHFFFFSRAIS